MSVDTVNGVERIINSGDPAGWQATEVVRLGGIGRAEDLKPDEFAWVSSVGLGPDQHLYLADIMQDRIAVFDTLGAHVQDIGRAGEGPGEFHSVYSIAWLADTLLVLDIGNARLSRWDGLEWRGGEPAPGRLVASPVTYRLYQVGPSEVYQWAYRPDEDILEGTWRGHGSADGLEWRRERLPLVPPFPDKVVCQLRRGVSWWDHPYADRSLAHPAPDGSVYLALSDAYAIFRVSAAGDTLQVIERASDPVPLTAAEWERTTATYAEWLADKTDADCSPARLPRPSNKPPLVELHVDAIGRLWVERNLETGTEWEVFDRGRLVGVLPGLNHDRLRGVPWIGANHVAWITRDSLDVPYVHLARFN